MRFIYSGGTEFDGSEMPAAVVSFGVKFIEGVPTEVLRSAFDSEAAYKHAVVKLKINPLFSLVDDSEGAVEILDAPKKRGRPAKVVSPLPEPVSFEDAVS